MLPILKRYYKYNNKLCNNNKTPFNKLAKNLNLIIN